MMAVDRLRMTGKEFINRYDGLRVYRNKKEEPRGITVLFKTPRIRCRMVIVTLLNSLINSFLLGSTAFFVISTACSTRPCPHSQPMDSSRNLGRGKAHFNQEFEHLYFLRAQRAVGCLDLTHDHFNRKRREKDLNGLSQPVRNYLLDLPRPRADVAIIMFYFEE